MKNIAIVSLIGVLLWSCDEPYRLDTNQADARVIIEGQVTNRPGYQYVKVTRSGGFYETGETPRVDDALVQVTDDTGNVFNFVHNPGNKADSIGYYLPATPFTGEVGKTYSLNVIVDEEQYEAVDKMFGVTNIDSLSYRVNEDEKDDPKDYDRYYEILLYAKEPQGTDDYYLFKFFRNDSLKLYNETDIYFADDETIGEDINGVASPVYFKIGDVGRIEMYSLSRTAYVFYSDLQSLLNNDGGLFSQPPADSRSNLTNGALGFFQASAMDVSTIEIKE
jgi:hypothetical protein